MPQNYKDYVWVIAYIRRDYIHRVEQDLMENGFGAIKVYIPTVRILKKQFKNKNIYEYVPLLFNYGFFQLPYNKACDQEFLRKLREKIPAIYSWVLDPLKVVKNRPNLRFDNKTGGLNVAIAKEEEIATMLKASQSMSVFSDDVVNQLKEGEFLMLKMYPYNGMPAEIVSINKNKKQVKVKLLLETMMVEATVSFENIFYTVYSNFEEETKEISLEEIGFKNKRKLDKLYAQIDYGRED